MLYSLWKEIQSNENMIDVQKKLGCNQKDGNTSRGVLYGARGGGTQYVTSTPFLRQIPHFIGTFVHQSVLMNTARFGN